MKCKCQNIIPNGRLRLGFKVCVSCSKIQAYGCAPLINHKTGNSIQIMSSEDAKKIAKMTQRRGYGTMLGQRIMSKKYTQKPAEKPGAMILAELIEQEIKNGDLKWNKDTQKYERNDK